MSDLLKKAVTQKHLTEDTVDAQFCSDWLKDEMHLLFRLLKIQREALEDVEEHGTRHDLTPTGIFHKDCGHFDIDGPDKTANWISYLKSADQHVRQRAHQALDECERVAGEKK